MADEPENPELENEEEEAEIYDNRSYNLWISFNSCTITNLHIEQYGKPVNPPPKGGG